MQAVIDRPPTIGLIPEEGGGGAGWVRVYRARGDIEAHLLAGRLEAAGIGTSCIKDRTGATWLHGGSDPFAPVDVMVMKVQLDDARIVLAEIAYEQTFEEPSPRGLNWRTVAVWWSAALALGLAFTGIALARTSVQIDCVSWHCEEASFRP